MFYRLVFDRGEYLIRVSLNYGLWQLFYRLVFDRGEYLIRVSVFSQISVKYHRRENWLLSLLCLMYGTLYMYIKFCSIFKNHVTFVFGNFNIDSITSWFCCFFINPIGVYPPPPKGEGGILFYLCPSFRPSKIFFGAFFSVTVDGRNLIFGHKHHIGIPYCG